MKHSCAVLCLVARLCPTLRPHGLQPARLLCAWHFPGKNTGDDCHALLQEIFPTQGSNPVSRIAGGFFAIQVTRGALGLFFVVAAKQDLWDLNSPTRVGSRPSAVEA